MFRVLLYVVLLILFVRAMSGLWRGIVEGASGGHPARGPGVPPSAVQMVRDPVCGTFVVPGRALTAVVGGERVYFCSPTCRDSYHPAHGRTA